MGGKVEIATSESVCQLKLVATVSGSFKTIYMPFAEDKSVNSFGCDILSTLKVVEIVTES